MSRQSRQRRSEVRKVVYKAISISTLDNIIDWAAFSMVWDEAVPDRAVAAT
jgi:hypothetical protein